MKRTLIILVSCMALLSVTAPSALGQKKSTNEKVLLEHRNQAADEQAIEQVIDRYIESINLCDTTLLRSIWSYSDAVSYIAPTGYYVSFQEMKDNLWIGVFGNMFTSRKLQKYGLKIHVSGNNAWSEFRWTFDAVKTDGTPFKSKGQETQILEKGADGWRLVHSHYSGSAQ